MKGISKELIMEYLTYSLVGLIVVLLSPLLILYFIGYSFCKYIDNL